MLCCQCVLHLFISGPELIPTFKYFAYVHIVCRPTPGPKPSSCPNKWAPKRKNCVLLFAVIEGGTSSALNQLLKAQINWDSIEPVTLDLTFLFPRWKSRMSALVSHYTILLVSPLTPSTVRAAIPCSLDELRTGQLSEDASHGRCLTLCFQPDGFPHSIDTEAQRNHKHSLELCPSGHVWPLQGRSHEEMLPSFTPVEDGYEMYFTGCFTPKVWDWACLPWTTYKHILV